MKKSVKVKAALVLLMLVAGVSPLIYKVLPGRKDLAFFKSVKSKVKIEGEIIREPDIRNDCIYLVLNVHKLSDGRLGHEVGGNLLVKLHRYPEYVFGDLLEIEGSLTDPALIAVNSLEKGANEKAGSSVFSYEGYLGKEGIKVAVYYPKVRLLNRKFFPNLMGIILVFKDFISAKIESVFPATAAGLVGGVLLGARSGVPPDIMDDFNRAGLTHILAISGYNITLLINIVAMLTRSLGRRSRFLITVGVLVFFAVITGLSASVIRASLMGGLFVLSSVSGRKADLILVLLLSGALMVLFNPYIFIYDISFQLSFMATFGLIVLMPFFERFTAKLPVLFGEALMVTLAAQIFTTPITLYNFGRFSVISPLTNIIFLPLIPPIMLFSFFAIVCAAICLPFTVVFTAATCLLVEMLVRGVQIFSALPFASINVAAFGQMQFVFYYLVLVLTFYKSRLARGFFQVLSRLFRRVPSR